MSEPGDTLEDLDLASADALLRDLRDGVYHLHPDSVRASLNYLKIEFDRATIDLSEFVSAPYGTPLEYDPEFNSLEERSDRLWVAMVALQKLLDTLT